MLHDDRLEAAVEGIAAEDVARLRLMCLVRAGDGYVVRGAGRLLTRGDTPAQVDIAFGDAGDRRSAAELDHAVRHIQRWCDLGVPVALLSTGDGVTLRAEDGTAVPLPRCAA
jgi:hypothetical protein